MPIDAESFVILENVDSTNNYAMGKIYSGEAKDGNAWFAKEQTNGKGQRGKTWEAQKGQNIILSIVADTRFLQAYQQFQLSVAISLSCYDFFKVYHNIKIKIKWPNDLFWNDRKAGGILIENVIKGNFWQWAVIGIGINVNQTDFSTEKNTPVSLKLITGQACNVVESGKHLYKCVIGRLKQLKANGFEKMLIEYNGILYKRTEKIKLKRENIIFETIIKGVSPLGQLQTFDNIERTFDFGEIEWVL
jgi:BirA family biotin operon repressor/biotin-[acetyl-CoA-carboxylase] ligase